jgi:hypothetical protein
VTKYRGPRKSPSHSSPMYALLLALFLRPLTASPPHRPIDIVHLHATSARSTTHFRHPKQARTIKVIKQHRMWTFCFLCHDSCEASGGGSRVAERIKRGHHGSRVFLSRLRCRTLPSLRRSLPSAHTARYCGPFLYTIGWTMIESRRSPTGRESGMSDRNWGSRRG